MQSRNATLGFELGRGRSLADILAERRSVAEGVTTAEAMDAMAARLKVDMPIASTVSAILAGRAKIDQAIRVLLSRPLKHEA
jgi:glycerol-3-phosphate dehydrogenase (NAD(P)+)